MCHPGAHPAPANVGKGWPGRRNRISPAAGTTSPMAKQHIVGALPDTEETFIYSRSQTMSSIDKLNEGHFTDLLDLIRNTPLGMKYKIDF